MKWENDISMGAKPNISIFYAMTGAPSPPFAPLNHHAIIMKYYLKMISILKYEYDPILKNKICVGWPSLPSFVKKILKIFPQMT